MNKISAVIIDDEFFNRKLISMLIAKINPFIIIDGEAENVRDGFKIINTIKPNIVFLDIKMPDGSGFELLNMFAAIDFEVVFITGFDQYALQAFDFNALDYVLKPIDVDKFKLTLDKVEMRIKEKQNNSVNLKQITESYNPQEAIITKIPVHYNDSVVLLNIDEIMYILSDEAGTTFVKDSSEKYSSAKPLSAFGFILDNFQHYVRIDKNTYINVNYISNYPKSNESHLIMKDGITIEISARKKSEILELLNPLKKGTV